MRGAVVAIEPRTGKILAMVSSPTYNPNRLASHDFTAAGKTKQRLESANPSPLNNRAIEEVLPPGSTFKLVTAAAALDSGKYTPRHEVPGTATLDLPQTSTDLVNESRGGCGGDQITLTEALRGLVQRLLRRRRAQARRRRPARPRPRSSGGAPAPSPTSTTP